MRLLYFSIISALLLFSQIVFAQIDCRITSTLKIGSRGAEVECLQNKVGVVPDGKFGPLTRASVMAFQTSNGLVADGIVGPLSRAALGDSSVSRVGPNSLSIPVSKKESLPKNADNVGNVNPNLAELDQFIETVIEVSRKKGLNEKEISLLTSALRKEVRESNIDYDKKFEELLVNESKLSFFDQVFSEFFSFLDFSPAVAEAQTGTPFGGALIFPFFCTYNSSWMITVQPLPPTFVTLLTYYPGTQGFASYNIPYTSWLLGSYSPPGICMIPGGFSPITIPTEGTILPMTGSSPF